MHGALSTCVGVLEVHLRDCDVYDLNIDARDGSVEDNDELQDSADDLLSDTAYTQPNNEEEL